MEVALPVSRYRFKLAATETIRFSGYSGSAWRGLFGRALRHIACITRQPQCTGCSLCNSCAYSYLFETPVSAKADKLSAYPAAPHPFVFDLHFGAGWPDVRSGEKFDIGISLFGRGNDYLPYVVHAVRMCGRKGIGPARAKFDLLQVEKELPVSSDTWVPVGERSNGSEGASVPAEWPGSGVIEIELMTPLRVKRDGQLVGPEEFEFHDLYRALLRRLSLLSYFHANTSLQLDFRGLVRRARDVRIVSRDLYWRDWTRYSARQRTQMQMGGLLGRFRIAGIQLESFWAHLWIGQWAHVGKGTSMGLGRYRICVCGEEEM